MRPKTARWIGTSACARSTVLAVLRIGHGVVDERVGETDVASRGSDADSVDREFAARATSLAGI